MMLRLISDLHPKLLYAGMLFQQSVLLTIYFDAPSPPITNPDIGDIVDVGSMECVLIIS